LVVHGEPPYVTGHQHFFQNVPTLKGYPMKSVVTSVNWRN